MSQDPHHLETRLKALAQRAEDLRRHCPYRFYSMSPEDVQTWLDRHYVPTPLGWSPDDAQRLGPLLGLPVPGDYLAFLEVLGNLHHGLFGYDNDLRTPEDYVRFRQECLEYDLEAWDGADQDPQFAEMVRSSLFLNTLGGFAVWYLLCGSTEPTSVRTWLEGDVGATGRFEVEGLFIENIEARMDRFECRVKLYRDLGGTLVYGRGGQIPAGHAIGGELLDLPHDGWSVELTESQLQRIRVMWRTAEL